MARLMVSQRVAPNASIASRWLWGTALMTSLDVAVIIGVIMMAKMMPAARNPTPKGGPRNKGRKSSLSPSHVSRGDLTMGTSTNSPQRPMITLGIAANISMMKEAGILILCGANSVRKMAAPKLIGTAITRAMAVL